MKNFSVFLTFAVILACLHVNSQNVPEYTPTFNSMPSSPEAALLGRFGEIPIGYYTGTADISIPIYTIEEGGVQVPITLRYHSSGIKVSDEATWVGLGWSLDPGGAIISETRGRYDLELGGTNCYNNEEAVFRQKIPLSGGYFMLNQVGRETVNDYCLGDSGDPDSDPYCWITHLVEGGEQPDIYHYNFSGFSGKYYLDENGNAVLLDKKEEIIFEGSNKARTLDGTVFTFGALESSTVNGFSQINGHTSKLTNIALNNGQSIDFTYLDEYCQSVNYVETSICNGSVNEYAGLTGYSSFTEYHKKTLTQITTSEVIINFNLEDRLDILPTYGHNNIKRLKSIDIISAVSGKTIKSFDFNYNYFNYSQGNLPTNFNLDISSNLDAYGKRLKLESVQEIGYDVNGNRNETKPPYYFQYDESSTLPLKVSASKDFYGYYNGKTNLSLLPDLSYFQYPYDPRYKLKEDLFTYKYDGANRLADTSKAGAYMLNKIVYPTGGFTEFTYEPNSFENQFIPNTSQIGALQKINFLQDKNQSTDVKGKTFQLSKTTVITFENQIYDGYIPNMAQGYSMSDMMGSYIELLKVDMTGGSPVVNQVKKWDLSTVLNADFTANHGKEWKEDIIIEFDPNPNIYYTVNVFMPDHLVNNSYGSVNVKSRFFYYDDTGVDTSISHQGGMRIKSIKNRDSDGTLLSHKRITYYGGKLLNKFEPLEVTLINNKTSGGVTNGTSYEYIGFHKRIAISSDDFGLNGGNLIGYSKVEEEELAPNATTNGKTVYYFDNEENITKKGLPNIPNLRNGLLNKKEVFNNSNDRLFQENYHYGAIAPGIFYAAIKIKKMALGPMVPCMNSYYPSTNPYITAYYDAPSYSGSKYSYHIYPINSAWIKLKSKTTTQFFGTNQLTSTETFTYNSNGKRKTIETRDSKGKDLLTKIYYAEDHAIGLPFENNMVISNRTGIPLLIENYKDNLLLSETQIHFDTYDFSPNDLFLTSKTISKKGGVSGIYEETTTLDKYDEKANILQMTSRDEIVTSFIWGHNQTLPVAKIENASYAQIEALPNFGLQFYLGSGGLSAAQENSLRSNLPNAMVTTYQYDPLIGVTAITAPNGDIKRYYYDPLGRLETIKDADDMVISGFQYNYQQ